MAKLFRCMNADCATHQSGRLGHDFFAEEPVCPKCQADARKPREASLVIRLSILHFDPPSRFRGIGLGYPVCNPGRTLGETCLASGHPEAVTCPRCKNSPEWQKAMAGTSGVIPEDEDFEVALNPKTMTIEKVEG